MIEKACHKCGLIQPYDRLMGYMICSAPEAELLGCPPKDIVLELRPEWRYEDKFDKKAPHFMPMFVVP